MKKLLDDLRRQLNERDCRMTPQRATILEVFVENQFQHLTAEEVYRLLQAEHPEIGLATVYRTIELLAGLGILYRLDFGDGRSRYEYNAGQQEHYHHHLICRGCRKIEEFTGDLLEDLEELIEREHGFQVINHALRFYGYCADCRRERKENQ